MWRPEGWRNPFRRYGESASLLELMKVEEEGEANGVMGEAYEAGGQAMLVALKAGGEYLDASKAPYGYVFNNVATYSRTFKGWVILIPEEG